MYLKFCKENWKMWYSNWKFGKEYILQVRYVNWKFEFEFANCKFYQENFTMQIENSYMQNKNSEIKMKILTFDLKI